MALSGIQLSAGILVGVNKSIDAKYGPYPDVATAKSDIGSTLRYLGLTVGIITGGVVEEYWWESGIANDDLVVKGGGGGGAVDSVNGQVGVVVLDADDIDDTSTTNKFVTAADLTILSNTSGVNTGDQDLSGLATITYVDNQDFLKVDKVVGKGLSTNDFTDALETKLNGIEAGAEVNVNADWNAISGDAQILNKPTIPTQGLTSVALTMPPAFSVANTPLTSNGTLAVTALGTASQYIKGDGQLATFPTSGGGGSSVSYYLNGGVNSSVAGYKQMSNEAVIGVGTNFPITGNGLIAQFLTDVGNPNRIQIPGGAWNFELYFNVSSAGVNPKFYVDLLEYDGISFNLIASGLSNPEVINGGTSTDLYLTSLAVPTYGLSVTDRLAIRVYIIDNAGGVTVTLHTEDNTLCEIITTFSGGVTSLNGLTANTQYLSVGTVGSDFNINSLTETHTFNLPTASASNRGALSSADWSTFNGKQNEVYVTPEQFGAVGDGVTDDKIAIQNAVNSGKPIQLKKKRYYISGSIELIEGTIIIGTGTGSITNIYITANEPAFLIKGNNINIERISFIGDYSFVTNSYSTSKPNQHAIALIGTVDFVTQYDRILISNCTFYNMSGAGFYSKYNIGGNSLFAGGAQLTNNLAFGCAFGYYNDVRGEYNSFVNNKAYYCAIGYRSAGGNNIFTGGILNSNNTGAYLESGANNGHSFIDCTSLNHNFQYGVWTNGITLGYTISNSPIYANDIYVQDSIGIKFFNCDISCNNIYVQSSTLTEFKENKFTTSPTLSLAWNGTNNTGTLNTVRFFNNFFWGANPAGLQNDVLNNNLDVSGEISSATETASTIASFDSNKKIKSLPVATYPSLTELTYVKGVTSAIQTQLNGKQALDATLTALSAYNTNGILTQTAADTFTGRTITGTTNQVTVTNGNGVAGNPTLSLPQNIHTAATPQFANLGLGATANLASYLNVIANTASVGQIYFPPSAVDYTGTLSGMLWNNTSEWKFYDGVLSSVNRLIKLNGNSILANSNPLNVVTSTGTGGNLGTLKAEVAFSRYPLGAGSYTISLNDIGFGWIIACTTVRTAASTITLLSASSVPSGFRFHIYDETGDALQDIRINSTGGTTIGSSGATTAGITGGNSKIEFYSDGVSKWFIL